MSPKLPHPAVLILLPLVAGCTAPYAQSPAHLADRLQRSLTADLDAGRVTIQQPPQGASVTLAEQALFVPGKADLTDNGRDVLVHTVQALLDPAILRIEVAGSPSSPPGLETARARTVVEFLKRDPVTQAVQSAVVTPTDQTAAPGGVTITATVVPPAAT